MANSSKLFSLILILSVTTLLSSQVQSQTPSAPAPESAGPANLAATLGKNGQFKTFLRLLKETQVGSQIENQLNSSSNGMTVLAPTDNAFNNLKAGTLNDLTNQQQVQLVLYHVIPQFLTFANLQTVSNPVRTQATGSDGVWGLRFTAQNNQVNVSSGVAETSIYNPLREDEPLAVYQVDKVLLPEELSGTKKAAAPEAPTKSSDKPKTNSTESAKSPEGPLEADTTNSGSVKSAGLGVVLGVGVMFLFFS